MFFDKLIQFKCMIFTWRILGGYFQLIFNLISGDVNWYSPQIVLWEDRAKHSFKND